MSKTTKRKVAKVVVMAMTAMLTMQNVSMVANAADQTSKEKRYVISRKDEFIEIGGTGEKQQIKLTKGKTYIFSYPILNRSGLKIASIGYRTKDGTWKTIDLLTAFQTNEELVVHLCEYGPGKVLVKMVCMTDDISELKTQIKDEHTGEIYEFSAGVEVQESQNTSQYDLAKVGEQQSEGSNEVSRPADTIPSEPAEKPDDTIPSKPAEKPDDNETSDDIIIIKPPAEPDDEPEIIIIDTSKWKFSQVTGTYNGKEFAAVVEGIPEELKDIVKLEYINNTRTNAGEQMAYVKFTVPEGYQIVNSMETKISIDKAKYEASLGKRSVEYFPDGSMRFKIPSVDMPDEIKATYTVNGVKQDDSSFITDSGVYVVTAQFESENYEVEDVKTVYYVEPPIIGNNAKYKLRIDRMTEDPADENGQIKVMIWMESNDNFTLGSMQYKIRYDGKVLRYISAEQGSGMSHVAQNEYLPESGGNGTGAALGLISNNGELVTLTFELLDPDAKDIAFNLTDIYGKPGILDQTIYETYGTGIHLIQQPDTNTCTVYLPQQNKQVQKSEDMVSKTASTMQRPENEISQADGIQEGEVLEVVNDIAQNEADSTLEIQTDLQKPAQENETNLEEENLEEVDDNEAEEQVVEAEGSKEEGLVDNQEVLQETVSDNAESSDTLENSNEDNKENITSDNQEEPTKNESLGVSKENSQNTENDEEIVA